MRLHAALFFTSVWVAGVSHASPGDTYLISARDPQVTLSTASGQSANASVSADGRFIAFDSFAGNLVAGDTNSRTDVFVYDRSSGTLERVSLSTAGEQGNSDSIEPSISADGRFVAFSSNASNLVADDTNEGYDVFVHDRQMHVTVRASVSSSGAEAVNTAGSDNPVSSGSPSISGDGRVVVFSSNAENLVGTSAPTTTRIFVRDLHAGTTTVVSADSSGVLANETSFNPAISGNGQFVAFTSLASNLVAGDTNDALDIFVRDLQSGATQRVSVSSSGAQAGGTAPFSDHAAISQEGRFVAFQSSASDLVGGDTNETSDIFVHDRQTGQTERVSVSTDGAQGDAQSEDPTISADGRLVLFTSLASNIVATDGNSTADVFVRDRQMGATTLASLQGNGPSSNSAISADGQITVFQSVASNFVSGDQNDNPDVFVRALSAPAMVLVSAAKFSSQTATGTSETGRDHALSDSGRLVAFKSTAAILVQNDTNPSSDVFVRDIRTDSTALITRSAGGDRADSGSFDPVISANGRFVAYQSFATNLVTNDTNDDFDIFVHDRQTQTTSVVSLSSTGEQATAASSGPSISFDGQAVAFVSAAPNLVPGDPDEFTPDVFVRDTPSRTTARANSVQVGALEPSVSADGRYVAFVESSQVYILERRTGRRRLVSVGLGGAAPNGFSGVPSISANGRYVAFYSQATNLVPGDEEDTLTGVYVRDRMLGVTTRVSESSLGASANSDCFEPAISGNGRYIAFYSDASNLVSKDSNNTYDIFVHDRLTGVTTLESVNSNGIQSNGDSVLPSLSHDGLKVAFTSKGSNLAPNDFNEDADVFVHERRPVPVVRINAGGPGFTDSKGHFWQCDRGFTNGNVSFSFRPIANTMDDALYQNERWDQEASPEMRYKIPVPNGTYWIRLHFAENYPPNFGIGRRVFDVEIEGLRPFIGVDIFKEAGARAALVKSASVTVTDGELNLRFLHRVQNPLVNAIEVLGQQ